MKIKEMRNNEIIIKNSKIIHISFRPRSLCVGSYLKLANPLPREKLKTSNIFHPWVTRADLVPGITSGGW